MAKIYLKEKELPVSGRKSQLERRVADFQEVGAQAELGAVAWSRTSVYRHRYLLRVFQQVPGVSRACGWRVESLWLECREPVAGVSRACGWSVESLWLECR